MVEELYEPGAEVWVRYRGGRWYRGTVTALRPGQVEVEFTGAGDRDVVRTRRFDLDAEPARVMPGSYARPVRMHCEACGFVVRGTPGQPAEQVWRGHVTDNATHDAAAAALRPRRPAPRLADLVPPDELVWSAGDRQRMLVHRYRPAEVLTTCGLIQSAGETITCRDAISMFAARPCKPCFPLPDVDAGGQS